MHPAGKIKELPDGFGIGKDCAALQAEDEEIFVITHDLMQTIPENYMGKDGGIYSRRPHSRRRRDPCRDHNDGTVSARYKKASD